MIKTYKAIYGAKDSAHQLLFWEHPTDPAPRALLGLTDKPPGHLSSQDMWWPAFGCGPVENWWCMWWTVPDSESLRKGMVRSTVFLWKLTDIHNVDDLLPYIEELSAGGINLEQIQLKHLLATADALVSRKEDQIVALQESNSGFPLLIRVLWKQLWPEAKRSFSARTAVTPPQRIKSVRSCTLYCVPPSHINQWKTENVRVVDREIESANTAALHLAAGANEAIERLLINFPPQISEISGLSIIARCSERLEQFEKQQTIVAATDLLRSLVFLYPEEDSATSLKRKALAFLNENVSLSNAAEVLGLANLNGEALPSSMLPVSPMQKACSKIFAELSPVEMQVFFERISTSQVQQWWKTAAQNSLKVIVQTSTPIIYKKLLRWIGQKNAAEALKDLMPSDELTEDLLVSSAGKEPFSTREIEHIKCFALIKQWSKLYAWALLNKEPSNEFFRELVEIFGSQARGRYYLLHHLPAEDVVSNLLSEDPNVTYEEAAERTRDAANIFLDLDISNPKVVKLWLHHITSGGDPWPFGLNKDTYANAYINVLVSNKGAEVLPVIAKDVAPALLNYPERNLVWACLATSGKELLSSLVAEAYILSERMLSTPTQPETIVADKIVEKMNGKNQITATLLLHCLAWERNYSESDIIRWMSKVPQRQFESSGLSVVLGQLILKRGWSRVAEDIYSKCFKWGFQSIEQEYLTVLKECADLLTFWRKYKIELSLGRVSHLDRQRLIYEIARIGNELAYNELDGIWSRAGGKMHDLKRSYFSKENWLDAAQKADQGKIESGLLGLVNGLLAEYPQNAELKEIKNVLIS